MTINKTFISSPNEFAAITNAKINKAFKEAMADMVTVVGEGQMYAFKYNWTHATDPDVTTHTRHTLTFEYDKI